MIRTAGCLYTERCEDGIHRPIKTLIAPPRQALLDFVTKYHIYMASLKSVRVKDNKSDGKDPFSLFFQMAKPLYSVEYYWQMRIACPHTLEGEIATKPRLLTGYLATNTVEMASRLTMYRWGKRPPTHVDLLRFVAIDVSVLDASTSLNDWCERMCLDEQAPSSHKLYQWVCRLRGNLHKFLGAEQLYEELMLRTHLGVPVTKGGAPLDAEPSGTC